MDNVGQGQTDGQEQFFSPGILLLSLSEYMKAKTDLQRMNFIYINEKNDMISVYVSSIAQQ